MPCDINGLKRLRGLDIILPSMCDELNSALLNHLSESPLNLSPLRGLDLIAKAMDERVEQWRLEAEVETLEKWEKKHKWNQEIADIVGPGYDAFVLTDHSQTILWVNKGFTRMTGYSAKEALGQRPVFLQGEATKNEDKARLREGINSGAPFTQRVVNYRKSNELYECEVTIHPLRNADDQVTHYLALEKEVA